MCVRGGIGMLSEPNGAAITKDAPNARAAAVARDLIKCILVGKNDAEKECGCGER
jgi:hypothetical protein